MKQLVCEMCGGTDLIKQDGVFICQNCGTKYSPEEAKRMIIEGAVDVSGSTVKLDNEKQIENLIIRGKQFEDSGEKQKAIEYYNRVLDIDANNEFAKSRIWDLTEPIITIYAGDDELKRIECLLSADESEAVKYVHEVTGIELTHARRWCENYKLGNGRAKCEPVPTAKNGGCYVATCVYGSYDCPQVWTLRRFRDYTLAETWYGRAFIRVYYAVSPTLVKWFGHTEWFKKMWRGKLDRMVAKLQADGVESTSYEDRVW